MQDLKLIKVADEPVSALKTYLRKMETEILICSEVRRDYKNCRRCESEALCQKVNRLNSLLIPTSGLVLSFQETKSFGQLSISRESKIAVFQRINRKNSANNHKT
jgi:hypothetical protein